MHNPKQSSKRQMYLALILGIQQQVQQLVFSFDLRRP